MVRARALVTMAPPAELVRSVCLGIASTVIVATRRVTGHVWRAAMPKKAAGQMEHAATLLRKRIPITIAASVESAAAMACAAITMALHVRHRHNASRIIASTPFVAATSARALVMRVRP